MSRVKILQSDWCCRNSCNREQLAYRQCTRPSPARGLRRRGSARLVAPMAEMHGSFLRMCISTYVARKHPPFANPGNATAYIEHSMQIHLRLAF